MLAERESAVIFKNTLDMELTPDLMLYTSGLSREDYIKQLMHGLSADSRKHMY